MSAQARASRAQLWLEGLGEWSWPGRGGGPGEFAPPAWIPALPPRLEPAVAAAGAASAAGWGAARSRPWPLGVGAMLCVLACVGAMAWPGATGAIERLLGAAPAVGAGRVGLARAGDPEAPLVLLPALPALTPVGADAAGSRIVHAAFTSASLPGEGSFFVYLPPGYASGVRRYPVVYLLHGRNGHANAFLEIGIQAALDRLIDARAIPPLIAVMIQDRPTLDNWRDRGEHDDETYVVEVQELVDRMLRTIPTRAARAIVGDSMGGFGAMNVALSNPLRFAVVESWLGFFNNLEGALHADREVISRLGLHAFLYGAAADPVAVPAEDPEFAGKLREEGAQAESAIYPGGHSLEKVQEHLETGLLFAGRSLVAAQRRAAGEASLKGEAAAQTGAVRPLRATK